MRFVATGDLQIGMPARGLGDEANAFRRARIDVIATLGRVAREHDAAVIVIAGDLFDRVPVEPNDLARTLDAIGELDVPVLVLPGNHDSHDPDSVWRTDAFRAARPAGLTVLLDEPVTIDGWEFHGAPLPTRKPDRALVEGVLAALPPDGGPRVVVGHGSVDAVAGDHGDPGTLRLAELSRSLAEGRARMIVLGDRHSTLQVDDAGRVWYPGAPEPTTFGDGPGRALVVELGDASGAAAPSVTEVVTGTWRFERLAPRLTGSDDVTALLAAVGALERKGSTVLQVRPSGALGLADLERLERGLDDVGRRFAVLDPRLDGLSVVPELDELDELPLPTYAREVADELARLVREAEERGEAHDDATDELRLLLRLAATAER